MDTKQLHSIIDEIKKQTSRESICIRINTEHTPIISDSKFGGVPYWDIKKQYPQSSTGEKLMLLAQINFDDYEFGELFPKTGMLQFFVQPDDMMGLDLDKQDVQDRFRVVYHDTIDEMVTKEEVLGLDIPYTTRPEQEDYTPILGEYAIEFEKGESFITPKFEQYDAFFWEVAEKLGIEVDEELEPYDIGCDTLGDEEYEELLEELNGCGHRMLGHPYFTQNDPREEEKKYRRYDTLLFQMDSEYGEDEDFIMWGDCGVANFFINQHDLEKGDFSKVLYNWDCC